MQLSQAQREVIVLRFFEDKTLTEVAEARRQSVYATQKSLKAGMANLRRFLAQRGVAVSLGAVGIMLAAESAKAVPVGLVTTVGAAALHGGAGVSVPVARIVERLGHHAGRAKLLASLAVVAVIAGVGIFCRSQNPRAVPSPRGSPVSVVAKAGEGAADYRADIEALRGTLRRAETALREMDAVALAEVVAFRDADQSARWQAMSPVFAADLALRRAAAARFGANAERLTAMKTFADRLDEVLPTVDRSSAAWDVREEEAAVHFSYRGQPEGASLFFVKTNGHWQIDAARSVEVVLEGMDGENKRSPLERLSDSEQARVLTKMQALQHAIEEVAERISGGQVRDIDEARQALQLADAQAPGRAFFKLALRGDEDRASHE